MDLSDQAMVTAALTGFFDATVGYHPLYGCENVVEHRTFIGSRRTGAEGDRVFVLTSAVPMTIVQARAILVERFNAMYTMQLDSGGSTQFYACAGGCQSSETYRNQFYTFDWWCSAILPGAGLRVRPIPEVLAIYDAP